MQQQQGMAVGLQGGAQAVQGQADASVREEFGHGLPAARAVAWIPQAGIPATVVVVRGAVSSRSAIVGGELEIMMSVCFSYRDGSQSGKNHS
jgi:hypothetical protein